MLSEQEIDAAEIKFAWVNLNCTEHRNAFARAIESAACAERDARIAELTRELEEARKDAAAEREQCAKVAKAISDKYAFGHYGNEVDTADEIAAAIRARGTK